MKKIKKNSIKKKPLAKKKVKKIINKKRKKNLKIKKNTNNKKKISKNIKKNKKKQKVNTKKKVTVISRVVTLQNSLKPEFNFKINFSLEKYVQALNEERYYSDTVENYKRSIMGGFSQKKFDEGKSTFL